MPADPTQPIDRACPKHMVFGPCGGVRPDGSCEMRAGPCAFDGIVAWDGPTLPVSPMPDPPQVLTDLSVPPFDTAALRDVARVLAPACDAVLVGEHQQRPDLPPTLLGRLLLDDGVTPWITLACRDRNRVVLEQELRGLAHVGVRTVLCVTGDGRGPDVRPDVTQVFDLDGPRLASLAASLGLVAAVPETPSAPPRSLRARRLVDKQRAGAAVAVLNHVATAAQVDTFVADARAAGLAIPVLAGAAVVTDAASVAALAGLPGLELDAALVERVLSADDPVEAGIAAAVERAREYLAVEGVVGVNLSGLSSGRGPVFAAEVKAEVGRRLRDPA